MQEGNIIQTNVTFADIADSEEFSEFYEIMARLTGVNVVLTDNLHAKLNSKDVQNSEESGGYWLGKERIFYHSKHLFSVETLNPVCNLIRSTSKGIERCFQCDWEHKQIALRRRKGLRYLCHAGLLEIIVPIQVNGEFIALIMGGQIFVGLPSNKGFKALLTRIEDLDIDPEMLRKKYFQSPFIDKKKTKYIVELVQFYVDYFCEMGVRLKIAKNTYGEAVQKAKEHIDKHFREPVKLDSVADQVFLTPAYLSYLFKKETGMNLMHYLQVVRINETKQLLEKTHMNITKIALHAGFNDLTHFFRVFKKFEKCTPGQFREDIRKSSKDRTAGGG